MSEGIKTLGKTLIVNTDIRAVLQDHRWVTLPPKEWKFLLRISGPNWARGIPTVNERRTATRLRERIGFVYVESVRGMGYRLGKP